MDSIFKYNVSNIDRNYNFFINGVSTALNPRDNTLIFINKNRNEYLEKLSTIKEAIIILLFDIEEEKISKILNSNLIIFSKNPRLEYAKLVDRILKEVGYYNSQNYYLKDGYCYGENLKLGENIIIEELQKGYMYKDSVLRYSMVKVAN